MARVLVLDVGRRGAFDRNRIFEDAHRVPFATIAVLIGIGRVGIVDVQVFAIGAEDGESPCAEFVVADGNAGQHRLAAADDIPTRRDEMNPVTQRWRGDSPVRIAGQDGRATQGARAVNHPVVAANAAVRIEHQ